MGRAMVKDQHIIYTKYQEPLERIAKLHRTKSCVAYLLILYRWIQDVGFASKLYPLKSKIASAGRH